MNTEPIVSVRNVTFAYGNGQGAPPVLEEVSFEISGNDAEALKEDMERQVQKFFQQRMDRLVQENFEFDEQTSARFDPIRQQEWLVEAAEKLGDRSIVERWKCDP